MVQERRLLHCAIIGIFLILLATPGSARNAVPKVSIDVVNGDLIQVLRKISWTLHLNLIVDSTVKGKISLQLSDVPAKAALALVTKMTGYEYKIVRGGNRGARVFDHTIVVGSHETIEKIPTNLFID